MEAIYLLRRHFQVSADEYLHTLPAWEADLLLEGLRQEMEASESPAEPGLPSFADEGR